MPIIRGPLLLDSGDPINKGLVGFWPLNESGGFRAADISGQGRLVTLFNGPTRVPSAMGRSTNLASASSQYGTPSRTTYTQARSFVAWVRAVSAPAGGSGNTWVMTVDDNFGFNWNNNNAAEAGAAYIQTTGHGWQVATLGGTSIPAGVWHCLVAAWDGATLRAYRNGVLTGTNTPGSTGGTWTAMAIGRNSAAGVGYFNGAVSLVRDFNRAITPTEVARLYREPWAGTRRIPRRTTNAGAYSLAVDPLAYEYAASAVGLSSARRISVDPLAYTYGAQDVGLSYRQGAHTLDVEPLAYTYGAASVGLTFSGAAAPAAGPSRTRRGARKIYLPEQQATAVFHPNALPEELAAHAVKAWQDDEDDETWFLLA